MPVIDDPRKIETPETVRRVILCNGRIYIDLVTSQHYQESADLAIVRLEQLHSFPADELREILNGYPNLEQVIWVQEEPRNMGAWDYARPRLSELIQDKWPLYYVGRPPSSSPAEGSLTSYVDNQRNLIEAAYRQNVEIFENGVLMERG